MASSNKHWPSMFKSNHLHHHQRQHDVISHRPLFSSSSSGMTEERSPEPKPRWNPKPEQIRILEAIFNSGMVNPPREEIRRIRAQLQEYGQVGDANVFYWFQNRKSRSKHKQRHLSSRSHARSSSSSAAAAAKAALPPASGPALSSSSSGGSAGSEKAALPVASAGPMPTLPLLPSPLPTEFLVEPFYGYPETMGMGMWSELVWGNNKGGATEEVFKVDNYKLQSSDPNFELSVGSTTAPPAAVTTEITQAARSTVFINEVPFDVVAAPLNIREAFGEEAFLIHSSGNPVLTDQWGLTLQPLQHGASYYMV